MTKKKIFNSLFLIAAVLCLLYYIGMGLAVRFGQSLLWLWPCISALCLLRYVLVRKYTLKGKHVPVPRILLILFHIGLALCILLFVFVEFFIVKNSFMAAPDGLDCVIILGAKVNGELPSGALNERIHAAADYLFRNPDTLCIASGGQGEDEMISEAECMRRNLTALGISEDRIIMEEESVDTSSNLRNSTRLMPADTRTVGIVTNDFHSFRACAMALNTGAPYEFYGLSARSSLFGYVHYAMREFFSIGLALMKGNLSPSCFFG